MKTPPEMSVLANSLQRLADEGGTARFWLRDDDAVAPTPALERLLGLARRYEVPAAVAVIPAAAGIGLSQRLAETSLATPMVHGWAHTNHAPAGEKKQELGRHRPASVVIAELSRALHRMQSMFGDHLAPVLVPPWNRVDFALLQHLPDIGYQAVSVSGKGPPQPPLPMINVHVDPMDWHGTRGCRDHAVLAGEIARLAAEPDQAIGILTHHLVHDEGVWRFLDKLFELTASSDVCRWLSIADLLGEHHRGSE